MLQFNTNSWHFKIVMYVFGKSFFVEKDTVDWNETEKKRDIIWITKPKIVNLCPYCRAVLSGIFLIPVVWISKKIPRKKKEKKPFDFKKSQRNLKIMRIVACGAFCVLAVYYLLVGEYYLAALNFGIGSFQLWSKPIFTLIIKWQQKRDSKKTKIITSKEKNPSLLKVYLESKHSTICPAIAFIDPNDTEIRR